MLKNVGLTFLLLFVIVHSLFSQSHQAKYLDTSYWGVFVGGNLLDFSVNGVVNNKYQIYTGPFENYQGWEVGVTHKRQFDKFYAQGSLSYLQNTYFVQFRNMNPEEDTAFGTGRVWVYTGPIYQLKRFSASAIVGTNLTTFLRIQAGLIASYHTKDRFYGNKTAEFLANKANSEDRILFNYADSINRFGASGFIGLGVDLGKFTVDGFYESTITPYSKYTDLNNQSFPLIQRYKIYKVRLGYNF